MSRLLVIGCGGVAQVAISKICQDSETFTEIMIASRTKSLSTKNVVRNLVLQPTLTTHGSGLIKRNSKKQA
ncbi:dehydrogenase family protein%2C saccharopine dehydrogenase [Streptococcus pneumoniae]|nr:dehydrogenase family protein%2C saccharopine dehydrogenase [Streptococcus pneumoniae]